MLHVDADEEAVLERLLGFVELGLGRDYLVVLAAVEAVGRACLYLPLLLLLQGLGTVL